MTQIHQFTQDKLLENSAPKIYHKSFIFRDERIWQGFNDGVPLFSAYLRHTNSIMYTKLSKNLSLKVYRITDSTRYFQLSLLPYFMKSLHVVCIGRSSEKGFEKQLNFLDIYTSHFFRYIHFLFFFNFIAPLGIIDFFSFFSFRFDMCLIYTARIYLLLLPYS